MQLTHLNVCRSGTRTYLFSLLHSLYVDFVPFLPFLYLFIIIYTFSFSSFWSLKCLLRARLWRCAASRSVCVRRTRTCMSVDVFCYLAMQNARHVEHTKQNAHCEIFGFVGLYLCPRVCVCVRERVQTVQRNLRRFDWAEKAHDVRDICLSFRAPGHWMAQYLLHVFAFQANVS